MAPDPGDWLDEEDRAALHQALKDSDEDIKAGRLVDVDVIPFVNFDRVENVVHSHCVRRVYLRRVAAHLYYTFDDTGVVVRALWGARREPGRGSRNQLGSFPVRVKRPATSWTSPFAAPPAAPWCRFRSGYFTGTSRLNSSNQFWTTMICGAAA